MIKRMLAIGACLATVLAAPVSLAQGNYPAKPIRLIVPFPAGGALDSVGRVAALALGERLGVQVVVDNRGGASGAIGVAEGVRAPADGYTLIFASSDTITVRGQAELQCPARSGAGRQGRGQLPHVCRPPVGTGALDP